ncbi:MAG: UPF0234 protein Yitk, partial [uncultured Acidimicrobiales bacterium]
AHLRHRLRGGPSGGPQRRRPGRPGDREPLRLQGHGLDRRAGRLRAAALVQRRGAPQGREPGRRGEAGQAEGVAQGPRPRQGRGGIQGGASPDRRLEGGDRCRPGQEDQQLPEGPRTQGPVQSDPGRPDPGVGQEAGRPPGGHRRVEGRGLRPPAPVHQLPGL